jgi:O-acetyl-ADP-ribose deacetylase (regulator of RNase III)
MDGVDYGPNISCHLGDITSDNTADAIVNAANTSLLGGGGVDGAIHRAAGPEILHECRLLGGCAVGDAKATGAGRLAARFIIHAVGPVWLDGDHRERELLASCNARAVEVAGALDCAQLALPAISTGAYRFPVEMAAPIAVGSVALAGRRCPNMREIRFWLFDDYTYGVFVEAVSQLAQGIVVSLPRDDDSRGQVDEQDRVQGHG